MDVNVVSFINTYLEGLILLFFPVNTNKRIYFIILYICLHVMCVLLQSMYRQLTALYILQFYPPLDDQ